MSAPAAVDAEHSGTDLIVVAGHAPFRQSVETVPDNVHSDDAWVLQSFQRGEAPLYIEHIRRGVELLRQNPAAVLVFSGGYTRREAGLRWSEAATYRATARHFGWWSDEEWRRGLDTRTALEDYSRDSFENLLFSLCVFQQVTSRYPRHVTVVSWMFKEARFDLHRAAIRFPRERYSYAGFNQPLDLESAQRSETSTVRHFQSSWYGSSGPVAEKRLTRNPFQREHPFRACPGLQAFFQFIEAPDNAQTRFPGTLPWES
jgi:hypothetical protein